MRAHLIPPDPPAVPPPDAFIPESITPEALEFAEAHGLTAALPKISDAIRRYIPGLQGISVIRVVDAEIPDYILIFFEIKTSASVEECWEAEGKLCDALSGFLPAEQRTLVGISFYS